MHIYIILLSTMLYVYILKCSDDSYYTGLTNDPEVRLLQHNNGSNPKTYTFKRRPVEMVYCADFTDYNQAVLWEKQVKRWSRKKKEALINGDWDLLKKLSACKNDTSHLNKPPFDSAQNGIVK